jgi:formaldehyde-activating enzyme involved in methanogenesis
MPADCLVDYKEAMDIAPLSTRGAAALLRLALEKLLPHIGATKGGINEAVGELVANGVIPARVQQALDSVRVIGNEAVHPGELDLKDDAEIVNVLFWLMNFIVEKAIAEPKEIDRVYAKLPSGKLAGIANRDKPKPAPTV